MNADDMPGWQYDSYGLDVYSYGSEELEIEIFGIYLFKVKVKFSPLDVIPYQQWVYTVRPDGLSSVGNGWDMWLEATYSVRAAHVTLDFTHNMASAKKSLVDVFLNERNLIPALSEYQYSDEYKVVYTDPYWQWDLFSFL